MSTMYLGVVLHEEHIELLTADFKQLKKDIAGKKLEEGSLHFTGERQTGTGSKAQIHKNPSTTDASPQIQH